MLAYYKKLLTSHIFLSFTEGEVQGESQEQKINSEKTASELIQDMLTDGKLDGNDLTTVQELQDKLSSDNDSIKESTNSSLNTLKDGLKESTYNMLEKGYTVESENDYKVLLSIFKIIGLDITLPDYGVIQSGDKKDELFSMTYKEGSDKLLLYRKESYIKDETINTDEYGYIDLFTGEFSTDTNIKEFYFSFDDNIDNNNEFVFNGNLDSLGKSELIEQYNNIEIPEALYENAEHFIEELNIDESYTKEKLKSLIEEKLIFKTQREEKNRQYERKQNKLEQQEINKVNELTEEYTNIQIPELLTGADFDVRYEEVVLSGKSSSQIQAEIDKKQAFVDKVNAANETFLEVERLTEEYTNIQIPELLEGAEFDGEYTAIDLTGKNSSDIQSEIEKKQAFVKEIEAANDAYNLAQQQETERYDSVITAIKEYRTLVRNSNKLYPEVKSHTALADAMKPLIEKDSQASLDQIDAANLAMAEYKQEIKELETIRIVRVQGLSKRYREGGDKYSELEEQFNKDIQKKGKTTLEEMNAFEEAMNQIDNKSDSIDSTNSDKSFIDSTTDKIMSIYDKSIEFVDGEKIGSFTGENGEEVEIQYDSESKTLSIDTAFFDGVTDYDINRCFAEVDMSSRESAEETIGQLIAELQAEYNAKVKQYKESGARFGEVGEAMEKGWNATTEFVGETYEKVSKAIKEFLGEHPDLGTVTLDDGTELNIEFNETDNTFFVDTEFFDGVSDYNSKKIQLTQEEIDNIIDLLNGENSQETEKQLSDLVEGKSTELKAEYQEKMEANEAEKRNKRIKEVFAGNKKFTNVGEVTIGDETMDVRLVRRGLNDMKIKLSTPFGDGISDSEVTIDFAKTKDSFKSMQEVEELINEKTQVLIKYYKENKKTT